MSGTQHYIFALVDEFTHIAFSCAVEPLRIANLVSGKNLYTWSFASADGERAASSNGIVTLAHHRFDELPACDRLFVLSGNNMRNKDTRSLVAALRKERARGTPIGALCSGAYILAKAGFLDGMRAAIHWAYHDSFAEEFPDVDLVRTVFVADERFITSSGGAAAADLMLHMIGADHGESLASAVAEQMVYGSVRTATAAQRVFPKLGKNIRNKHLREAVSIMVETIDNPVSSADIAQQVGLSRRQVERLFEALLKTSPKKYFMELRLERARRLLSQSDSSVSAVAVACGFTNFSHFSRAYRKNFGETPVATMTSPCRF